jgi:hypothetical protein
MDQLKPTRADYMAGRVSHDEYYRAVVRTAGLHYSDTHPDVAKWREHLAAGDVHLNRLPLVYWDRLAGLAQASLARALRAHGDAWSLAGGVCAVKAAARMAARNSHGNS